MLLCVARGVVNKASGRQSSKAQRSSNACLQVPPYLLHCLVSHVRGREVDLLASRKHQLLGSFSRQRLQVARAQPILPNSARGTAALSGRAVRAAWAGLIAGRSRAAGASQHRHLGVAITVC